MLNIYTGYINEPTILQPFTSGELDFLQFAIRTNDRQLLGGMNNFLINTSSKPIALYGCEKTLVSGTTYTYNPGYIFVPTTGNFYQFTGGTVNITTADICNIGSYTYGSAVTFTDGIARDVQFIDTLSIENGPSGSGLFDFENLIPITGEWIQVGASGGPAFQSSCSQASFSEASIVRFKRFQNTVTVNGWMTVPNTYNLNDICFTLPANYITNDTDRIIPVMVNNVSSYVMARCKIESNGDVKIFHDFTGYAGNSLVFLDNVTFEVK
jgi:hypothetical protein